MTLVDALLGETYTVGKLHTDDEELEHFLFTLGCYEGQEISVVSHMNKGYVVAIKGGRYNLDFNLANAIVLV